jgi:hypothetical protein
MLYNLDNYVDVFGMEKLSEKEHPENIYVEPKRKYTLTPFLNNFGFRWVSVFRQGQLDWIRLWLPKVGHQKTLQMEENELYYRLA